MWYLNAYQSHFFNDMLARRLDRLDRILVGDWAMKMENGACFLVEDAEQEQPRADRFEISPTGILFGSRASWAVGEPGEIERAVVAESGATPEGLTEAAKACGFRGERRSLRIPLRDLEWAVEGTVLTLSFSLPPGAYATSVLRELMKTDYRLLKMAANFVLGSNNPQRTQEATPPVSSCLRPRYGAF